jgi:hypothetical protein
MMENPAEIDTDNMIKTTMEYLSKEQKKQVNDMIEFYREMCLDCFTTSCGGKTIQNVVP